MSSYTQTSPFRRDFYYRVTNTLGRLSIHLVLLLFGLVCLIPLFVIVSASFTDNVALIRDGYGLVPSKFSTAAYDYIFAKPDQIIRAYSVTIFTTVTGTSLSLLIMSLLAYPLSQADFPFRKLFSFFVFFTMLFNGGIVPFYILMTRYLHLQDSIWALIVPNLVGVWYVLILRTYFSQLPLDLFDAARVDGAGEWRIFFQLVLPLSKPALATIGLMVALGYWNDWVLCLYFINNKDLATLQYLLSQLMNNVSYLTRFSQTAGMAVPEQPVRMAMAVLATGPAALAFLFVQKYLVRGITLGSFK